MKLDKPKLLRVVPSMCKISHSFKIVYIIMFSSQFTEKNIKRLFSTIFKSNGKGMIDAHSVVSGDVE